MYIIMTSMEFERFIASWYAGSTYKYLSGNLLQIVVVVSLFSILNLLLYEPKETIQADIITVSQEYSLIHESLSRLGSYPYTILHQNMNFILRLI